MIDLGILCNENFWLLLVLYRMKDEDNLIRITQSEVSDMSGISRPTINKMFNILVNNKLITHDKSKVGHYYISDDAVDLIERMKESKLWRENNGLKD